MSTDESRQTGALPAGGETQNDRPRNSTATLSVDALGAVPLELREARRWIAWRYETRAGKLTKVPIGSGGQRLDATTLANAVTLAEAQAWVKRHHLSGVGIVLGEGLVGVDLDHCRNATTGELDPRAVAILARLPSWGEVSVSATGVHILAWGSLPPGRRRTTPRAGGDDYHVECYDAGRYFTVAGDVLPGHETMADCTEALMALHAEWFPPREAAKSAPAGSTTGPMTDADVLALALNAKNGPKLRSLWNGDTSGYGGDDSAADLALLCGLAFYTRDRGQLDRLMRASGLYREKWDRSDYRTRTIAAALAKEEGREEMNHETRNTAARDLEATIASNVAEILEA